MRGDAGASRELAPALPTTPTRDAGRVAQPHLAVPAGTWAAAVEGVAADAVQIASPMRAWRVRRRAPPPCRPRRRMALPARRFRHTHAQHMPIIRPPVRGRQRARHSRSPSGRAAGDRRAIAPVLGGAAAKCTQHGRPGAGVIARPRWRRRSMHSAGRVGVDQRARRRRDSAPPRAGGERCAWWLVMTSSPGPTPSGLRAPGAARRWPS